MSLKLRLKPDEKVIIGRAVIRNGPKACDLLVENNVPILRQKDILTEAEAVSPEPLSIAIAAVLARSTGFTWRAALAENAGAPGPDDLTAMLRQHP